MGFPPGFQWDRIKERRNIGERHLSFTVAAQIFDGPTIVTLDDRKDYGEMRFNALGFADGKALNVTSTERGRDIRIISARPADRSERLDPADMMRNLKLEPPASSQPKPE